MNKMQRCLFIRPPLKFIKSIGHEFPHPPLELLLLIAAVKDIIEPYFLDGQWNIEDEEAIDDKYTRCGLTNQCLINNISEIAPDIAVISCTWMNQKTMLENIVQLIKETNKETIVIVGGLLASAIPLKLITNKNIDYIIKGEGEFTLKRLIIALKKGDRFPKIPGLVYVKEDGEIFNAPAKRIEFLDELPFPEYEIIDFSKYEAIYNHGIIKNWPMAGIQPTRGCQHKCTFCSLPLVTQYEHIHHSIDYALRQLNHLKSNFNIQEIHFYDAHLLGDYEFAKKLFDAMIYEKLDLRWIPEAGLSIWQLSDTILQKAILSGMYRLDLPIESGSKRVRTHLMNKSMYDNKHIERVIRLAREFGISKVHGYIIVGYPGESIEDIFESLFLLNSLDLDYRGVRFAQPFPGTAFYDHCKSNGFIPKDFSFDDLWFAYPNIETNAFTRNELLSIIYADRALALIKREIKSEQEAIEELFQRFNEQVAHNAIKYMDTLKTYYLKRGLDIFKSTQKGWHTFS